MDDQNLMVLKTSADVGLRFRRMSGNEELGRLYEFDVQAVSESKSIKFEELLSKPASVAIELADGEKRYFHGLVCAIGLEGAHQKMFSYRLILRPWLWLLTRRSDTRIFQDMTMVNILKKVFEPFSPDYQFQVSAELPTYEYCVQYRESDFNFVSRLMEQEGVYYYFKHDAGKHTMVIVDAPKAHEACPFQNTFEFRESVDGHLDFEPVIEWRTRAEIQSGQVVLRDYDFTQPQTSLETSAKAIRPEASAKLEVYDYPGTYSTPSAGSRYSKIRIEELQSQYARVEGSGSLRGLAYGYRFTLASHPRVDQNKSHLVVGTRIECAYSGYESGEDQTFYTCHFVAMEGDEIFRPLRLTPKPSVAGLHTAMVVGPSGEEIHTDKHGRVKVQFHWDRIGQKNEKSSCWVRVASPWAGQTWGMISLPRIGQEVVIDFLEGDPDRPLITGRVYNGEQTPPYALPANVTVSTNKSRSSKSGGTDNFNELRFEDKKGSEHIWFQAERDLHQYVKNDATLCILGNQDRIVEKNVSEELKGDVKVKVGLDFATDVAGSESTKVAKDVMTEAGMSVSQKSGTKTDIKVGTDLGVEAGINVHLKAGVNVVIEAGVMLTLKAGNSSIVLGPAGVMVTGTMVFINSGGGGGSGGGANPKAVLEVTPPTQKTDPLA